MLIALAKCVFPSSFDAWNIDIASQIETATKKRRGGRPSLNADATSVAPWLERMMVIFNSIDQSSNHKPGSSVPPPPSTRALRNRTKPGQPTEEPSGPQVEKTPRKSVGVNSPQKPQGTAATARKPKDFVEPVAIHPGDSTANPPQAIPSESERKPLPRVILRLGKKTEGTTG